MTAKNAVLKETSHYIRDDTSSQCADGIGREEVYLYFSAVWGKKPVDVTMSADRYASPYDAARGLCLTPWRVVARDARFAVGRHGTPATETARRALDKLCTPLVLDWLASDAYTASFQAAAADLVMRKFTNYDPTRDVARALETFRDRLAPEVAAAIQTALDAYVVFAQAKAAVPGSRHAA